MTIKFNQDPLATTEHICQYTNKKFQQMKRLNPGMQIGDCLNKQFCGGGNKAVAPEIISGATAILVGDDGLEPSSHSKHVISAPNTFIRYGHFGE